MAETIASRFADLDARRSDIKAQKAEVASLVRPAMLKKNTPIVGNILQLNQNLPANYQSLGAFAVTGLEGMMLIALFGPGAPWFAQELEPQILYGPYDPESIQKELSGLAIKDAIVQAALESPRADDPRAVARFHTSQRHAVGRLLVLGDILQRLNDDFTITNIRFENYVTKRDDEGRVLFHVVRETVDPRSLTEDQRAKAEFTPDELKKPADLYTLVEWNPQTKVWGLTQEINRKVVHEFEEHDGRYNSACFELAAGDDYGTSWIETNALGDLRTLNELRCRIVEWAGLCAKALPALDPSEETLTEEDLARESGTPVRTRVEGGVVQRFAWLTVGDKLRDISFTHAVAQGIEASLEKRMLIPTARDSERTTAFEVQETTLRQIEGSLGSFYAPVADQLQLPLIRRAIALAQKKNLIVAPIREGITRVQVLTGLAALARSRRTAALLSYVEMLRGLGPEAFAEIDIPVLVDVLMRYQNVHEPGIIKSPEKRRAEIEEALRVQAAQAANQQVIQTAGKVVEQAAAAQ